MARAQLLQRVRQGTVRFHALLAPPRSGSTRVGLLLEESSVDLVITEPAGRYGDGEQRWPRMWELLLRHVVALEQRAEHAGRDLSERPLEIVSKLISHHIGPVHEIAELLELHQDIAVLIRSPIEATESNIKLLMELYEHVTDKVELPGFPRRVAEMKGSGWLVEDADVSHLQEATTHPEGKSVWTQHFEWMLERRDYSSLDLRVWMAFNKIFSTASYQREVWEALRRRLEAQAQGHAHAIAASQGFGDWERMVSRFHGTTLHDMLDPGFPAVLRGAFLRRQSGWDSLEESLDRLVASTVPYRVLDFGLLKLAPDEMTSALLDAFGLERRAITGGQGTRSFVSGYEETSVEEILFARAKQRGAIDRSFRRGIVLERFPAFIQEQLEEDLRVYLRLLGDERLARPAALSRWLGDEKAAGMEPVHAHMVARAIEALPVEVRQAVVLSSRREHPEYEGYFRLIDQGVVGRGSTVGSCWPRPPAR